MQLGALGFRWHAEARWVLAALVANILAMMALFRLVGPGPRRSLPHLLFWLPLLAWLGRRRRQIHGSGSLFAAWVLLLVASPGAFLALDLATVARWLSA